VSVRPVHNSGTLPIICEAISHVSIGCVCARSRLQKGLDSYQEEDLSILRDKWSDALAKRRDYLDDQLQKIMTKQGPYLSSDMFHLNTLPLAHMCPNLKWYLNWLSRFCRLTAVTDRQTDRPRYSVCNNSMHLRT